MARFSPQLTRLLVIRGIARSLAPIAVLAGIYYAWRVHWMYGLILAAVTFNYVIMYVLTWVPSASAALNGPLRIRPWQTLVLLANAILLPILYKRTFGFLPWVFIATIVLFFIGLYVATYIMFYLQDRSPISAITAAPSPGQVSPPTASPSANIRQ